MKRGIIFFLIIIVIAAIGAGVYLGIQKAGTKIPGILSTNSGGTLPVGTVSGTISGGTANQQLSAGQSGTNQQPVQGSGQQQLSIISSGGPVGFWISSSSAIGESVSSFSNSSVFYLNGNGDVVQITAPGVEKTISSSNLGRPISLIQNISGDSVVVEFAGGSYAFFDVKTKAWQLLDAGIVSVSFSPDGKRLVYLKQGQSSQAVYIRDVVKGKIKLTLVTSLAISDADIYWISANNLVLLEKPSFLYRSHAWQINLSTKTVGQLDSGIGLEMVFSKYSDSFGIRLSSTQRDAMTVSIFDKSHKQVSSLPFSTLAEKCAFSFDSIAAFCAVPYQNSSDGNLTLPDDFLMHGVYFKDYMYSVNLKDGTISSLINIPNLSIDAVQLASVRGELFFINRLDGKLYLLKLTSGT